MTLEETADCPWGEAPGGGRAVRAHEFHYSSIENLPADLVCAYEVKRGHGVDGRRDGIVVRNVLALSLIHI